MEWPHPCHFWTFTRSSEDIQWYWGSVCKYNTMAGVIGIYRISAKRQDWYAHPGDPRQLEAEYPQILTFIYGSAAKHLADYLQRSPSVFEINQHMMNRAKRYPFCMVIIVLYTIFAEVTKMMRKAELLGERGCVELYFTCLRFALPLFAIYYTQNRLCEIDQ
jgi:hypothetical protein